MLQEQPISAKPAAISPRARRYQDRHRTAADVNLNTRAGKRAAQLMRQFAAELGGNLTDTQRLDVERAGIMTAIAEDARVRKLHGAPDITYNDIVRLDRGAALAVAKLGIGRRELDRGPSLGELLKANPHAA